MLCAERFRDAKAPVAAGVACSTYQKHLNFAVHARNRPSWGLFSGSRINSPAVVVAPKTTLNGLKRHGDINGGAIRMSSVLPAGTTRECKHGECCPVDHCNVQ